MSLRNDSPNPALGLTTSNETSPAVEDGRSFRPTREILESLHTEKAPAQIGGIQFQLYIPELKRKRWRPLFNIGWKYHHGYPALPWHPRYVQKLAPLVLRPGDHLVAACTENPLDRLRLDPDFDKATVTVTYTAYRDGTEIWAGEIPYVRDASISGDPGLLTIAVRVNMLEPNSIPIDMSFEAPDLVVCEERLSELETEFQALANRNMEHYTDGEKARLNGFYAMRDWLKYVKQYRSVPSAATDLCSLHGIISSIAGHAASMAFLLRKAEVDRDCGLPYAFRIKQPHDANEKSRESRRNARDEFRERWLPVANNLRAGRRDCELARELTRRINKDAPKQRKERSVRNHINEWIKEGVLPAQAQKGR